MPTRCNRWIFIADLLPAQHVSGTFMPIIRSSRVLCKWLLSVVFGAWFSSCRYGVELRVVCPVCGLLQQLLHLVGILFPHNPEVFIYAILKLRSRLGNICNGWTDKDKIFHNERRWDCMV
jgi:hypothetical protein